MIGTGVRNVLSCACQESSSLTNVYIEEAPCGEEDFYDVTDTFAWCTFQLGFALGKHSDSILLADYKVLKNQANAVL